ncbi:nucleotidyltransferase family protein [Cyanobium sp. HWJ4-Hawea]|uniref:nucleotidyltransferase family protein n=1 Tax=Cyanobium sp. HWJ4-Hawea TaxID=2823713 RepID=UPI0020CC6CC5|nr:nucleotidyltransferase family protein [Cyanobium sp. HWJ4-Hawea]MCP9809150.1 nucleotidyltransferase family protein [Cyanobium sp. HWJ4-Hawea]
MAESTQQLLSCIREHSSQMRELFGVRRLRLFGSWARGSAGPESDVDVLVEFEVVASAKCFFGLQFFLEDLLDSPVDLVSEKALRQELRPMVEAEAITI